MENTPVEWRDVPGYDGAYQISWNGQVRSYRYKGRLLEKPRLLTPYKHLKHGKGLFVKLTGADEKGKDVKLIRLMAEVWKGGVPDGMVPYHKNGELDDNSAGNIGFTTRQRLGKLTGTKCGRRIPVAKVDPDGEIVEFHKSARAAAKANHMSYQAVMDRCNGKIKNEFALDGHTYRWDR